MPAVDERGNDGFRGRRDHQDHRGDPERPRARPFPDLAGGHQPGQLPPVAGHEGPPGSAMEPPELPFAGMDPTASRNTSDSLLRTKPNCSTGPAARARSSTACASARSCSTSTTLPAVILSI